MDIKFLLLFLLIFSTTPNLGFFTFEAFFGVLFCILIYIYIILKKDSKALNSINFESTILIFILLMYSMIYYGGLYQNKTTIELGKVFFFLFILYTFYNIFWKKKNISLVLIIVVFLALSMWTIIYSPKPYVDTVIVLKEAPLKFLSGQNPYTSEFTKVYPNIKSNYYNYMPFSFIYMLPFILVFKDPRYGIVFAYLLSAYILKKILDKNNKNIISNLHICLLLFFPRSFFMIEHAYLDPVLFMFFLIGLYYYMKRSNFVSLFFFSLFISLRQNLFLLPLLILSENVWRTKLNWIKILLILSPFLIILFFLALNPVAFLENTITKITYKNVTSPIDISLSLPTFIHSVFALKRNGIVYNLCFFIFAILFVLIIKSTLTLIDKITAFLLFFNFSMYHAFFSSYYLAMNFLLLSVFVGYYKIPFPISKKNDSI